MTLYEVWSHSSPFTDEPRLEGTFLKWNAPDSKDGVVQCLDALREKFYGKINALVWVKEKDSTAS